MKTLQQVKEELDHDNKSKECTYQIYEDSKGIYLAFFDSEGNADYLIELTKEEARDVGLSLSNLAFSSPYQRLKKAFGVI